MAIDRLRANECDLMKIQDYRTRLNMVDFILNFPTKCAMDDIKKGDNNAT